MRPCWHLKQQQCTRKKNAAVWIEFHSNLHLDLPSHRLTCLMGYITSPPFLIVIDRQLAYAWPMLHFYFSFFLLHKLWLGVQLLMRIIIAADSLNHKK